MTISPERGQHLRPVRKQQGITDIEKNYTPISHLSILSKLSAKARRAPTGSMPPAQEKSRCSR
jgi:hypothetical protein